MYRKFFYPVIFFLAKVISQSKKRKAREYNKKEQLDQNQHQSEMECAKSGPSKDPEFHEEKRLVHFCHYINLSFPNFRQFRDSNVA